MKAELEFVTELLTERERKVVYYRYQKQETLREISERFGVSKERIRQIEAGALRKLCKYSPKAV